MEQTWEKMTPEAKAVQSAAVSLAPEKPTSQLQMFTIKPMDFTWEKGGPGHTSLCYVNNAASSWCAFK